MESWVPPGYALVEQFADGPPERWLARGPRGEAVVLRRAVGLDGPAADRQATEMRRLAAVVGSLESPHVLPTVDVLVGSGELVLVASCAERGTLADLLDRRGRFAPGEVVTALAPIAAVLGELHSRGVVHGHVAAGNLAFAADGSPVLCDVGVREAIAGRPASGPADDVLALGRLGRRMLGGASSAESLHRMLEAATAADPQQRPDATSLAGALLRACPAEPVRFREIKTPGAGSGDVSRPQRRLISLTKRVAAAVAAIAVAAVLGHLWGSRSGGSGAALPALPPTGVHPVATATTDWPAIARGLVTARFRAVAAERLGLLSTAYVAGTSAAQADAATIRELRTMHVRPRGLSADVVAVDVELDRPDAAVLRVVDRLSAYALVDRTGRVIARQPMGLPTTVELSLSRTDAGWRISGLRVIAAGQPTSAPSAASTSS
ncbi:MAG: protein kinase [Frankiales bacterium]|nr:protein kinase [Frankiales bacterium]